MRKFVFLLALFGASTPLVAFPVAAEENSSPAGQQTQLMEKFAGRWEAAGTSFGLPSKTTMTWTTDLADKFYRIEFRIDMNRNDKTETFLGHGYYRKGSTDGFWADTGGALHPMVTSYSANELKTIWGKAGGQQGRSYYKLQEDGRVEVTDWILGESGWREFNRTLFQKAQK